MDDLNQVLLQDCKDEKIRDCLTKLGSKCAPKVQRFLISKFTKDILCDTLMFIAERMFQRSGKDQGGALSKTEEEEETETLSNQEISQQSSKRGESSQTQTTSDDNTEHEEEPKTPKTQANKEISPTSSSQKEISQTQTALEDNKPVCQLFLANKCPKGIKGKDCSGKHPKQCRHFLQGGRLSYGCQDWNCPFLHPRMCQNDYLFGSCQRKECKEKHTKQHQSEVPQAESSLGAGSFLWQREIQEQINNLTETNQKILQALMLGPQKTIPIWSQSSQPRWERDTRQ